MPSSERFHEVAAQVRNWGRWGDDDEIGTLNLITPEVRRAAAASVRSGKAFSLALPLDEEQGIQVGVIPGRDNPIHRMTLVNEPMSAEEGAACTSDDRVHSGRASAASAATSPNATSTAPEMAAVSQPSAWP